MWDPEARWVYSSFVEAVADPGTAPADTPLVQINVNASWVPYIIGCLLQMLQPRAWTTTDPTALADLLGRVTDLISMFGTAVAPMELRLSADGVLQTSVDAGVTWADVTGWTANMPDVVHDLQARVLMVSGEVDPPIPQQLDDGSDWKYSDFGES